MEIDLEIGDIVLGGKFKNKRMVVKTIGVDDLGQPTINGKSLLKFRIEKKMPRDKWSTKSKEESEKKMKITEKQLRKIVKQTLNESAGKTYNMQHKTAPMPVKSRASAEFTAAIKGRVLSEQSRQAQEGQLLGDLNSIVSSIEDITSGLYGLEDPGDPDVASGDDMAEEFEMQIERLNVFFKALEAYFESSDPEFNPNAPGMR